MKQSSSKQEDGCSVLHFTSKKRRKECFLYTFYKPSLDGHTLLHFRSHLLEIRLFKVQISEILRDLKMFEGQGEVRLE